MSARAFIGLLCLALCTASCQLGPGVSCSDDTPCAPWGRCGAQGFCVELEEHGAAALIPEPSDAGSVDAGESDAGR
jgi:hypothetical protein